MNGQYIIPTSELVNEPEVRSFESAPSSAHEAAKPAAQYQSYKEIENDIISMRSAAAEETLPRSVKAKVLELITSTPRPLRDRLIEEESIIGGRLFARDESVLWQRFWCHENDWFFEQAKDSTQGAVQTVLRYQIQDGQIDKFYGGRKYSVEEAETGILLKAVENYHESVKSKLYRG